jgi:hypothetical protein
VITGALPPVGAGKNLDGMSSDVTGLMARPTAKNWPLRACVLARVSLASF